MICKEIQETTEAATLFRGISLATKMVSAFCMQEGQAYCKSVSSLLPLTTSISSILIFDNSKDIRSNFEDVLH